MHTVRALCFVAGTSCYATIWEFCTKFWHGIQELLPNSAGIKFCHSKYRTFLIAHPHPHPLPLESRRNCEVGWPSECLQAYQTAKGPQPPCTVLFRLEFVADKTRPSEGN